MPQRPFHAKRLFDRRAIDYERHARLQTEVAARLLERLDGLRFEPGRILDIGCADGRQCQSLLRRFPKARVIGLDPSAGMLSCARSRWRWWKRDFELVCGDGGKLPLAEGSIDLIYANLSLGWLGEPDAALRSWRRVLRPGGLALISVYGPDTLRDWRRRLLPDRCTFDLPDVQQLGSTLVRAGFSEPVLDTDWITSDHPSASAMLRELSGSGLLPAVTGGLGGRYWRRALDASTGGQDEPCQASWEIVSASAWAPDPGQPVRGEFGDEVSVPLSSIGIRRRD